MALLHVPSMTKAVDDQQRLTNPFMQLLTNICNLLNQGYPPSKNLPSGIGVPQSVTIPVAKLTSGGTNGSMTFTNGLLTAEVPPT
jgi:hypothetical protein